MKTMTLGFIGGGRITKIFLNALGHRKNHPEKIVVFDTNQDVLKTLYQQFPFIETGNLQAAASQSFVFIALHPPVIMETLDLISEVISEDTTVVSLAPKITLEKMTSKLKTNKIARMIPNATSYINEGFNPLVFAAEMAKDDRKAILNLVSVLGKTFETEESKLEAYAITSAMLPTYFWFQFQEMEQIAQQCGLNEKEASKVVKSTLKRAIKLYFDSGLTPAEVMDLIPVKPIGEHETEIREIYKNKLMGLFGKIKP